MIVRVMARKRTRARTVKKNPIVHLLKIRWQFTWRSHPKYRDEDLL